jgi:hypothetical protein
MVSMHALAPIVLILLTVFPRSGAAEPLPPAPPVSDTAQALPHWERFGIEFGLLGVALMNTSSSDPRFEPNIDPVRVGGLTLILRMPTARWGWFRWTTLEFGGGAFLLGGFTTTLLVDTAPGVTLMDSHDWLMTANLGLGYGVHITRSSMEENSFGGGGLGITLVPTLRISKHASWAKVGTSWRCILPSKDRISDNVDRYAALLVWAFDLGW